MEVKLECEDCGTTEDVENQFDMFSSTHMDLCDGCAETRHWNR